jgi:hypothetical protein
MKITSRQVGGCDQFQLSEGPRSTRNDRGERWGSALSVGRFLFMVQAEHVDSPIPDIRSATHRSFNAR